MQPMIRRIFRCTLWLAPGAGLFTTSCGADVRDAVTAASLDFVQQSAFDLLTALVSVNGLFGV
jgi:hypothetical protein